jgi:predicted ferric reductase
VLYGSLGLVALSVILFRATQLLCAYFRLISTVSLPGEGQKYWTHAGTVWPKLKRQLLVAPLIRKRHNKELQISAAINVGTLPSRLHTLFLSFYVLTNVLYCCILDYGHKEKAAILAEARGRTGHLAVMNIVSLFMFSARNNPLIALLGVPFDSFNLFHRWVGRLVVVESLAHTFFWGVNNYAVFGLEGLTTRLRSDPFLVYGLVAMVAMVAIIIQSASVIRHAFYETFLHLHQFLVVVILAGILLHCEQEKLPQRPTIYLLISFWVAERLFRLLRIFYRRSATARIEALDGAACRVTFDVRGSWSKSPGCHVYIYFPALSLWMSHPFSVAWVESTHQKSCDNPETPSLSNDSEDDFRPIPKSSRTAVSCVIACRTGMTAALYRKARQSPTGTISLKAFLEGPYGGLENMRSYGTVLLFAGGVGITHQLTHLRDLLGAVGDSTCATRKVVLVWVVQSAEQLEWTRPWMEELLHMPRRGCEFNVLRYVTRKAPETLHSYEDIALKDETGTITVEEAEYQPSYCFGRPNVARVLNKQFRERVGAMCVGVCGPGGLADDVRAASRNLMEAGNLDFWEEAFTW